MKLSDVNIPKKEIEIRGRKFQVGEFNLNVLSSLEKKYNVNVMKDGLENVIGSAEGLRSVLYLLIKEGGNQITEEEVGTLINIKELKSLGEKITYIISDYMPTDEDLKNSENQPQEDK